MATPTELEISAGNFGSIREKLDDGFGFFEDGAFKYVVLDAKTHTIDVLRRRDDRAWSDLMTHQPGAVRVAINGQLFGPRQLYASAALGVVDPDEVMGHGSIREAGRTLKEDRAAGKSRYFFGRTKDGQDYRSHLGNPPEEIYEGMGGVGPLIITNPATGARLKIGAGNIYASDSGKKTVPETDEDWADCVQRNSSHFQLIDEHNGEEFTAAAFNGADRLLLFAVNTDESVGQLSKLRDKLLDAGFELRRVHGRGELRLHGGRQRGRRRPQHHQGPTHRGRLPRRQGRQADQGPRQILQARRSRSGRRDRRRGALADPGAGQRAGGRRMERCDCDRGRALDARLGP